MWLSKLAHSCLESENGTFRMLPLLHVRHKSRTKPKPSVLQPVKLFLSPFSLPSRQAPDSQKYPQGLGSGLKELLLLGQDMRKKLKKKKKLTSF